MSEHGFPDSRLTVIQQTDDYVDPNGNHRSQWLCECSCKDHNIIIVASRHLTSGAIKSCGCLKRESAIKTHTKQNLIDIDSADYGIGYTNKGEPFWFDKEDEKIVRQYCWHYNNHGYLVSRDRNTGKIVQLHRLLMEPVSDEMEVDHKKHPPRNENKYDNRKSNLEIKTCSQNSMNVSLRTNNTSGVTGVSWNKKYNQWESYIMIDYKRIYLGRFVDKEDAIRARKDAELKYFGEYRYDANN